MNAKKGEEISTIDVIRFNGLSAYRIVSREIFRLFRFGSRVLTIFVNRDQTSTAAASKITRHQTSNLKCLSSGGGDEQYTNQCYKDDPPFIGPSRIFFIFPFSFKILIRLKFFLFVYLVIVAVQGLVEDARVRPRTDDRVDDTLVTFTAEPKLNTFILPLQEYEFTSKFYSVC